MLTEHHRNATLQPMLRLAPTPAPDKGGACGQTPLSRSLAQFEPIGLAQMDAVALQDRTDTKYVFGFHALRAALAALANDYWALAIDGERLHDYRTLYFDSADFACYRRHHDGAQRRYKVRSREYVASERSFVEVKLKAANDRTRKQRIETSAFVTQVTPEVSGFIDACVPQHASALEPKLWNTYSRVTLVGKRHRERVTLDLALRFGDDRQWLALPHIAIAEVKQGGIDRSSPFIRQMRAANIRPVSFSKYCVGVALLNRDLKRNNFKPSLRLVQTLMEDNGHD